MGQTLSEQIEEREKKEEHKEALNLRKIEREMRQRYDEKKAKLYIDALNDECLPIICAVDTFCDFLYVRNEHDLSVIDIIMNKHLRGKYKAKFVDLIKSVVRNVLKKRSAESYTHVVYANMSFLRIDYYIYFTDDTLFYFVQVGVIDMERVRLPVLIYELTRVTQPTQLKELVVKAKRRAKSSIILHQSLKHLVHAAKQTAVTGPEEEEEEEEVEEEDEGEDEEEHGGGGVGIIIAVAHEVKHEGGGEGGAEEEEEEHEGGGEGGAEEEEEHEGGGEGGAEEDHKIKSLQL